MIDQTEVRVVLEGPALTELLIAGRQEWNQWVEENPVADVNFAGITLSSFRIGENGAMDFSDYRFPNGNVNFSEVNFGVGCVNFDGATFDEGEVNFSEASFGEGNVDFTEATFGEGVVSFMEATFGEGGVNFSQATFGEGTVFFMEATFGEGEVNFIDTNFGEGVVYFIEASFGEGDVFFSSASFGEGDVDFMGATFDEGEVSFINTHFGEGRVDFSRATFGEGEVNFREASFGEGEVNFMNTIFGEGEVNFNGASFGKGEVTFEQAYFKSYVDISGLNDPLSVELLNFRHATFEKTFNLAGNAFNCIVDLTNTKMTNQVSLEGLRCRLKTNIYGKALYVNDIERLRRLKEIADDNKDHAQALRFHADEMRAKRWYETKLFRGLGIDLCFDLLSRYGQSIGRPAVCLILSTWYFSLFYFWKATAGNVTYSDAFLYSISQALPFLPSSRHALTDGATTLFNGDLPYDLYSLTFAQGGISFIFIFLIGLGLRNRFRV